MKYRIVWMLKWVSAVLLLQAGSAWAIDASVCAKQPGEWKAICENLVAGEAACRTAGYKDKDTQKRSAKEEKEWNMCLESKTVFSTPPDITCGSGKADLQCHRFKKARKECLEKTPKTVGEFNQCMQDATFVEPPQNVVVNVHNICREASVTRKQYYDCWTSTIAPATVMGVPHLRLGWGVPYTNSTSRTSTDMKAFGLE
jgi:hypothetical protein